MRSLFFLLALSVPALGAGLTPEEATKRMKLPEGFSATLVAAEPLVRQPLSMEFDDRGRLWVLQYLQYPNPAGLKAVKQDQYLRTVWDRVPEPPPKGPKGIDRITILSDPDKDGKYTKSKDFLADLNLATGFCLGDGGVYVVQPPYLLFYPDKNRDDVPDGDPAVLLSGFGMEDTHSYANSLQFGPDGWLYGAHGSTVTAKIKNPAAPKEPAIEFQQGIWRYHPATKRFELFAEGGGNTYGLDFDQFGRCIAGTNYGGSAMLHHVQGAYYVKGFAKHGPLHNPHAYGYFEHVPYEKFKGGHVTCGGVVYQADRYPPEMQNQYIAGNLLSNAVYWHKMTPNGSTFKATHGGDLMTSDDIWFRPVDCFQGPDGCVYVADWYDKRAAHLDPIDSWDKTSGRIYRIDYKEKATIPAMDLSKKTSAELCDLLAHPNKWYRNMARRLLGERNDTSVQVRLEKQAAYGGGLLALESLWAVNLLVPIRDEFAMTLLESENEHVRAWAVRLIGDRAADPKQAGLFTESLVKLAKTDPSVTVRSQLACTAKRLEPLSCVRIALALADRDEDRADPHIPLLVWWALEPHVGHPTMIFENQTFEKTFDTGRNSLMMMHVLIERIARRMMAGDLTEGTRYAGTEQIQSMVPDALRHSVFKGMEAAMDGQAKPHAPEQLHTLFDGLAMFKSANDPNFQRLRLRFNHGDALQQAHAKLTDGKLPDAEAVNLIQLLGQLKRKESLPILTKLFQEGKSDGVRSAAMLAVAGYADPAFGNDVLAAFPKMTGGLRAQAQAFLLGKPTTAGKVLEMVEAKQLDAKTLPIEQLRPLADFKDAKIDTLVLKHWGKIGAATPGEKQARITWLGVILGRGAGNKVHGKELFTKNCASCHQLFGEGAKIGPDLTTADRKNRGYLLAQIVDPSGYVRPEYLQFNVTTNDGRRLTGVVQDPTETAVTLVTVVDNKPVRTTLSKTAIDELLPSPVSLMPEKMLDTMTDDDIRDLFAYMQMEAPMETPKPKDVGAAKKLKVLLVSGSVEYKSDDSLALWQKHLEANHPVEIVRAFRKTDEDIPDLIDGLDKCDVAVFFTRRLKIDGSQLDAVKKYAASGKPVIGIRTASHGFQNWLAMDKEVFGGDYGNHYGHDLGTETKLTDAAAKHPVMAGVKPIKATGGLYKNANVAKDVTVLMTGTIPDHTEPVTWTREREKGRVFYTSLGHPKDFEDENFVKMLDNALTWVTKTEAKKGK